MVALTRYRIRFERPASEPATIRAPGYGVTAHNLDDAVRLLRIRVLGNRPMLPIRDVIDKV